MPIRAYFEPVRAPLNRLSLRGGLAGNGIKVEGPVLEGRMSVDEALVLGWIRGSKPAAGGGELTREVRRRDAEVLPGRRW